MSDSFNKDNLTLKTLSELILFGTASILILLYLVSFISVLCGTRSMFLIAIIILFIVSNFAAIATTYYLYYGYNNGTIILFLGLRDLDFNLAHWFYSYKYWHSAIEIENIFTNKMTSSCRSSCNSVIFYLMTFFIFATSFAFMYFGWLEADEYTPGQALPNDLRSKLFIAMNFCNFLTVLIASFFLGDSVRRIRRIVKTVGLIKQLNDRMMCVHALTLFFYLLASGCYLYAIYKYAHHLYDNDVTDNHVKLFFESLSMEEICSFVSQLALCYVMTKLGRKTPI